MVLVSVLEMTEQEEDVSQDRVLMLRKISSHSSTDCVCRRMGILQCKYIVQHFVSQHHCPPPL